MAISLFAGAYANAGLITSLSGQSYIDDKGFIAISTNDTLQGTVVATSTYWKNPTNFTGFNLLADVDYYIHIFVDGGAYPNNVIGEFNIDSISHQFENGTQTLGTNKTDWLWGTNWTNMVNTPKNVGSNFSGNFSASTENIFRANTWPDHTNTNAYFTAKITAVESVPEPSTLAIFALGMIGFASRRFRKQS